jgi:hypothetical protein
MDPSGALTYFKCHATARAFARMVDWQLWCDVGLGTSHLLFLPVLLFLPGCVGPSASSKKGGQFKLLGRWSFPCRPQARSVGICVVKIRESVVLDMLEIHWNSGFLLSNENFDPCCQWYRMWVRIDTNNMFPCARMVSCQSFEFMQKTWKRGRGRARKESFVSRGTETQSFVSRWIFGTACSFSFHVMCSQCVLAATSYDYASWSAFAVATALLEARSTNF